jgi:hypothetical protein
MARASSWTAFRVQGLTKCILWCARPPLAFDTESIHCIRKADAKPWPGAVRRSAGTKVSEPIGRLAKLTTRLQLKANAEGYR